MQETTEPHENPPSGELGKSIFEEANGNYILAGVMFFDRLPIPKFIRMVLKYILILIAIIIALCALLWPIIMRYI